MNLLRSRFRGCLLGVHLGDTLGSPFEGDATVAKTVLRNYLNNMLANKGNVQVFSFTDDTCMTISLAESLLKNNGFNAIEMAKQFTEGYFQNTRRGYGYNVVDVFNALHLTNYEDPFLPAQRQFNGTGSYGNGAAMRIAPAALFGLSLSDEQINELVANCSKITHSNAKGINGAILQCHAIRLALKCDGPLDAIEFVKKLLNQMRHVEGQTNQSGDIYTTSLEQMLKILEGSHQIKNPTTEQIVNLFGNNVSAMRSVPSAIYCAIRAQQPLNDFETDNPFLRSLFISIALGGDTDTIASMACAIVGALHGDEKIPDILLKHCENPEISSQLADELYKKIENEGKG
ncbi:ADP-ribosylhydrolase ARH3-like [Brevipalpus obovatus]|uniref:ADP-ribosylhydrolase ARH3-like n=1 Tax=Brevipalpus obovatus TaxID=246614 RepID=UPI003D9EA276